MAHNAAERGKRVGVFSLEMSREQLVQRLLAVETAVDSQQFSAWLFERRRMAGGLRRHRQAGADADLYRRQRGPDHPRGALEVSAPGSRSGRRPAHHRLPAAHAGHRRRDGNRVQEVSEISRSLKMLARELNIPVIACAQLSRAVESRTNHVPMLSDLRELGSIEQDADIVMFIHREEMYNPETEKKGIAEIYISKHRNGPLATIRCASSAGRPSLPTWKFTGKNHNATIHHSMTKPFTGFSTDRQKTVRVPEGFFEDLLPQITSTLEMKVTLHLFWRLSRNGRNGTAPRMISLEDLESDAALRAALSRNKGPRPVEEALREGLELAVARGTVLHLWVREEPTDISDGRAEQWFVLNTRESREWVEALGKGTVDVLETPLVRKNEDGGDQVEGEGKAHFQASPEDKGDR